MTALSPLQPAAKKTLCHILSCQNAYQKEREERKLYSIQIVCKTKPLGEFRFFHLWNSLAGAD